jgi:hypothetical protein
MHCSILSAASTAKEPNSVYGAQGAKHAAFDGIGSMAARAAYSDIELLIGRQANRLDATPLGSVHSLHR